MVYRRVRISADETLAAKRWHARVVPHADVPHADAQSSSHLGCRYRFGNNGSTFSDNEQCTGNKGDNGVSCLAHIMFWNDLAYLQGDQVEGIIRARCPRTEPHAAATIDYIVVLKLTKSRHTHIRRTPSTMCSIVNTQLQCGRTVQGLRRESMLPNLCSVLWAP